MIKASILRRNHCSETWVIGYAGCQLTVLRGSGWKYYSAQEPVTTLVKYYQSSKTTHCLYSPVHLFTEVQPYLDRATASLSPSAPTIFISWTDVQAWSLGALVSKCINFLAKRAFCPNSEYGLAPFTGLARIACGWDGSVLNMSLTNICLYRYGHDLEWCSRAPGSPFHTLQEPANPNPKVTVFKGSAWFDTSVYMS